ncbi:hypothetical protein FRB99_000770 [Tulasnella sp. 403]|nr:hypothetical protein FRB99_000770 [Tulasnella sp. 403]
MHPALCISEILSVIFDFLLKGGGEGSLVNAACTTSIFLEPALDRLWRNLDDFKILIKVWPLDALARDQVTKLSYRFSRMLKPQDWERFDYYSTRVHHLSTALGRPSFTIEGMHYLLHRSFCDELSRYMVEHNRPVLLPNLKTLRLSGPPDSCVQLGRLLVSSTLTTLQVAHIAIYINEPISLLLAAIAEKKPRLTSLSLPVLRAAELFPPYAALFPALFPSSLVDLSVHDTFFAIPYMANHVCSLPSLKRLEISSDYYYRPVVFATHAMSPMLSLRHLSGGRSNIYRIVPFTPDLTHLAITTLYDYETSVEEDLSPSIANFRKLVEYIGDHCRNLQSIEVAWDEEDDFMCELCDLVAGGYIEWGEGDQRRQVDVTVYEDIQVLGPPMSTQFQ